ncbi:MAG: helix-turn-helix domain-containing protein [Sphingosinicella sp.]|uniref:helix-turn-helix domain-containing protein n=1 Tax=Sphingosinicella sp. TaxID=1917971 RepID=UPI00403790D8
MATRSLLPPPVGLEMIGRRARLPRHRHYDGFIAIVLSGAYQESGDAGRFDVVAGDALVHAPFEAHRDHISAAGATVINLPCPVEVQDTPRWRMTDPEALAVIAARDPREAARLFAEQALPCSDRFSDWPDLLASGLRELAPLCLAEWASAHGLAPESVSRGFARAYGVTPHLYRAEARARRAIAAIRASERPLAAIASHLGFSDQAHMTRAVL